MSRVGRFLLAAVLALVACGRVDAGSADSSASAGTGGVDAAGGAPSGGQSSAHTGVAASGGLVGYLPEPWGPCKREYVGLEPPCGESDVNGLLSSCGVWFDVPVADVVPPALDLQIALLPLRTTRGGSGLGGMGGVPTEPLVLDIVLVAPTPTAWDWEEPFDLLEPVGYVRGGAWYQTDFPGYVADQGAALGPEDAWYGVAQVALLQGTEILSLHRGLVSGSPEGFCVK